MTPPCSLYRANMTFAYFKQRTPLFKQFAEVFLKLEMMKSLLLAYKEKDLCISVGPCVSHKFQSFVPLINENVLVD